MVIGVVVLFALVDTPNTRCSWLTEDEQKYCRLRLENQDGGKEVHAKGQTFSWKLLWTVLTDWQFYPMALIFWSNTVPGYGLKFSMPQIIKNMGFTSSKAQLMYALQTMLPLNRPEADFVSATGPSRLTSAAPSVHTPSAGCRTNSVAVHTSSSSRRYVAKSAQIWTGPEC